MMWQVHRPRRAQQAREHWEAEPGREVPETGTETVVVQEVPGTETVVSQGMPETETAPEQEVSETAEILPGALQQPQYAVSATEAERLSVHGARGQARCRRRVCPILAEPAAEAERWNVWAVAERVWQPVLVPEIP